MDRSTIRRNKLTTYGRGAAGWIAIGSSMAARRRRHAVTPAATDAQLVEVARVEVTVVVAVTVDVTVLGLTRNRSNPLTLCAVQLERPIKASNRQTDDRQQLLFISPSEKLVEWYVRSSHQLPFILTCFFPLIITRADTSGRLLEQLHVQITFSFRGRALSRYLRTELLLTITNVTDPFLINCCFVFILTKYWAKFPLDPSCYIAHIFW